MISGTTAEVGALLTAQGWERFPADASVPLDELAKRIVGSSAVRAKAGDLTPRERADAQAFSLSGRFGLGAFDAHTDGAADPLPPRWCFMRLAARSKTRTPTLLWDLRSLELPAERLDALRRGMWAVRGGPRTFYSSILRRHGDAELVRFNRICMQPVSRRSAQVGDDLATTLLLSNPFEHVWEPDEVLVFDNWRVLHARPEVDKAEADTRRLERLLVGQDR